MNEPTKVTKIEFEKPITLFEGDTLHTALTNTPTGMKCECVLETADGSRVIIGGDLEDVVE